MTRVTQSASALMALKFFGLVQPPRHSLARRRDGYRSALAFTKPPGTFGLPASVKSSWMTRSEFS